MNVYYTAKFRKKLAGFERKTDRQIRERVKEVLRVLGNKNLAKGIRLHKVTTSEGRVWSVSLGLKVRMIFTYVRGGILLIDLGQHDQVYD